jgi:hypothetical protein
MFNLRLLFVCKRPSHATPTIWSRGKTYWKCPDSPIVDRYITRAVKLSFISQFDFDSRFLAITSFPNRVSRGLSQDDRNSHSRVRQSGEFRRPCGRRWEAGREVHGSTLGKGESINALASSAPPETDHSLLAYKRPGCDEAEAIHLRLVLYMYGGVMQG